MEEVKKEEKITLSNDGLSSLFTKREEATIEFYKNDSNKIDYRIIKSEKGSKTIKYYPNDETNDYIRYLKRLEEVIDRNKIKDTDKVFFGKLSKYPRTAFNRYSEGAKRIQNLEKADKIVIGIPYVSKGWTRGAYQIEDCVIINPEHSGATYNSIIELINGGEVLRNERTLGLIGLFKTTKTLHNNSYGNSHRMGNSGQEIIKKFINLINIRDGKEVEIKKLSASINFRTVPDAEEFELLYKGDIPISKFVSDKGVNRYIEQFKTRLGEDNYDLLLSALTTGTANISMGLKLLENMSIEDNLAYYYALMTHTQKENCVNIRKNKLWNSIGMKNLRSSYMLDELIPNYPVSPSYSMSSIEKSLSKITDVNQKNKFIELTKDLIENGIVQILGTSANNLIEFKVKGI